MQESCDFCLLDLNLNCSFIKIFVIQSCILLDFVSQFLTICGHVALAELVKLPDPQNFLESFLAYILDYFRKHF